MNIRAFTLSVTLPLLGAAAYSATPAAVAMAPAQDGLGTALGTVYHSVTGEPLSGMTIVVTRLGGPEGATSQKHWTFVTGKDGKAIVGPLPEGDYEAHVERWTQRSDPAFFHISGSTDSITEFALLFNPDIDR
jgi:hypothetical protein